MASYEVCITTRTKARGFDSNTIEHYTDQNEMIDRYNELVVGEPIPGHGPHAPPIESVEVKSLIQTKHVQTGNRDFM